MISFIQDTDNLLKANQWIRKVNDKRGELTEIWVGGRMVYRGEVNEKNEREGRGIAYDKEAEIEYEGIFKDDECVQFLKFFDEDEMIQLLDNGRNTNVADQVPVYVGGYTIDDHGEYIRNGTGYLIDTDKRIAAAEIVYENGVEVHRRELHNGWYLKDSSYTVHIDDYYKLSSIPDNCVTISDSFELKKINDLVTKIKVTSNCCNDITSLSLNQYKRLKEVEIGDNCFENVDVFTIDGLDRLNKIKIGKNSFTHLKCGDELGMKEDEYEYRKFQISNCAALESIQIGQRSFADFAGRFKLYNLPMLLSLTIGAESCSDNFYYASFVVKNLPHLQYIQLGDGAFCYSLCTVMANLPNLKVIKLGSGSLCGDPNDQFCSLQMKNLEKLETITSGGKSFNQLRSVALQNLPRLIVVSLPASFQYIRKAIVTNVPAILAKRCEVLKGED